LVRAGLAFVAVEHFVDDFAELEALAKVGRGLLGDRREDQILEDRIGVGARLLDQLRRDLGQLVVQGGEVLLGLIGDVGGGLGQREAFLEMDDLEDNRSSGADLLGAGSSHEVAQEARTAEFFGRELRHLAQPWICSSRRQIPVCVAFWRKLIRNSILTGNI
jgi:hypothetical protein